MKRSILCGTLLIATVLPTPSARGADPASEPTLTLHVRTRVAAPEGSWQYQPVHKTVRWDPKKTAIVICDMWNEHW
ncbi:MAG: hypothetical protein ACYSWU_10170, partial [Planctomycetota bacterium]